MNTDLKALTGKMNQTCHQALEAAAGLCLARGHHEVDIEHVLLKLLETDNTDLARLLQHYGVDAGRFQRDIERALDRLKGGCSRRRCSPPPAAAAVWCLADGLRQLWREPDPQRSSDHGAAG
ncbi:hypothetical protein DCF40_11985 [Edwardsiella piscicida]|nr:Clp protease N-terminal domain-containing protein [Edwardsiella piscicida]UCQ56540.1 hypothetical protein DCF40_11985 [Edwardsiella piscicida]